MEFKDIIESRRSVRSFSDKDVSDETLNQLLSMALESPSSSNSQPYKIAIAKGEVAKQIAEDLQDKCAVVVDISINPHQPIKKN